MSLEYPSAWLCWILPMIGAVLTPLFAKINPRVRDYAAVLFSLLAAISTSTMIPLLFNAPPLFNSESFDWIPSLNVKMGVVVDPLSIIMANIVAWISFLIMVYSLSYMHGEPGLTRYWFFMNFFIGSMLLLVMADNMLLMFFGWEGVGVCSYALIGFWYRDSKKDWLKCWVGEGDEAYPPSHAGMKAFIMTRIGDVCLLASIFIIYAFAGTFSYSELLERINQWAPTISKAGLLLPAAILFFMGPVGKSAQFPLHEWLPDAMAGPTSVSALIHAATMVKAGVYLVARVLPIFWLAYHVLGISELSAFFTVIAWIGAFTAFLAATQAMVSREIKKVLAYSTVSQIGYMFLALGAGGLLAHGLVEGLTSGMFHLMSHAIFKAALFLSAGAIIHAVESRFMYHMGGLRRYMPLTYVAMWLAALSLAGVPPFSGFWSKEAVLAVSWEAGLLGPFVLAIVTAALTVFYTIRMMGLTFHGEKSHRIVELEAEGHKIEEASPVMYVPYAILAIASLGIGVVGWWMEEALHHALSSMTPYTALHSLVPSVQAEVKTVSPQVVTLPLTIAMLIAGAIPAYFMYVSRKVDPSAIVARSLLLRTFHTFFFKRWFINKMYYNAFAYPLVSASRGLYRWIEVGGFDRALAGFASTVVGFASQFRKLQTGFLNYNIIGILMGLIIIALMLLKLGGLW
ncbi:MAG: NADH-quinone oxidoreductase subunit L [Candidatus Nezhaarchaeota archaeon]|nr:NADH-quinone oxidoreductase subunit L [Candidatus Nezhaarchaeota archaeon]